MSVRPNIWRFVVEHFSAIARRSSSIALDLSELHGESPNALNGSQKRYRFRSFARIYKVKWFCSTYAPRLGQALTKCCHAVVRRLMMQMMSGAGSSRVARDYQDWRTIPVEGGDSFVVNSSARHCQRCRKKIQDAVRAVDTGGVGAAVDTYAGGGRDTDAVHDLARATSDVLGL